MKKKSDSEDELVRPRKIRTKACRNRDSQNSVPPRTGRGPEVKQDMYRWPWGIILIFLSVFLFSATIWYITNIGDVSFEQLLFHMRVPVANTGFNPLKSFGIVSLVAALIASAIYYFAIRPLLRKHCIKVRSVILVNVGILILTIVFAIGQVGFFDYLKNIFSESSAWEKYYVEPSEVVLTFPEEKRNVIYINLESLESTYTDKENGGAMQENLIPNLTDLVLDNNNISFSHSRSMGGARQFGPLAWTAASLVGQMGGIPLKLPTNDPNAFNASNNEYLPGATMIGDILKDEGYYLEMLMGSSASFASRDDLYNMHGGFVMTDYSYLARNGFIPIIDGKYEFEFWGINDVRLFEIARERLSEISQQEEPFFVSILTVDTHFPDGYQYKDRVRLHQTDYANSIMWSDHDVAEFVEWCQAQDFAENTTIILAGDHLSMDKTFFNSIPKDYQRRVYNVILNSAQNLPPDRQYNRLFTVMDFFPTTLAAMGVEIEGNRLAYGVNLYSDQLTLYEMMGEADFSEMLDSLSSFYNDKFLYNVESSAESTITESQP